jgi:hypothetical protein
MQSISICRSRMTLQLHMPLPPTIKAFLHVHLSQGIGQLCTHRQRVEDNENENDDDEEEESEEEEMKRFIPGSIPHLPLIH